MLLVRGAVSGRRDELIGAEQGGTTVDGGSADVDGGLRRPPTANSGTYNRLPLPLTGLLAVLHSSYCRSMSVVSLVACSCIFRIGT